jgi:hypothetical protein
MIFAILSLKIRIKNSKGPDLCQAEEKLRHWEKNARRLTKLLK